MINKLIEKKIFKLSNWSIKMKLMSIIGILLICMVLTTIINIVQMKSLITKEISFQENSKVLNQNMVEMESNILKFMYFDGDNLEFYTTFETANIKNYAVAYENAMDAILLMKSNDDDQVNLIIGDIQNNLDRLNENFEALKKHVKSVGFMGFGKIIDLTAEMNGIVSELQDGKYPELLDFLFDIKKYETGYLIEKNRNVGTLLTINMGQLNTRLENPKYTDVNSVYVKEKIKTYKSILNEIIDENESIESLSYLIMENTEELALQISDLNHYIHANSYRQIKKIGLVMFGFTGILTVFILLMTIPLIRLITRSLVDLSLKFYDISDGEADLTHRLKVESDEEIGKLSAYFNRFIIRINDMIKMVQSHTEKVDHTSHQVEKHVLTIHANNNIVHDAVGDVVNGIRNNVATMKHISKQMHDMSLQVHGTMEKTHEACVNADSIGLNVVHGLSKLEEMNLDFTQLNNRVEDNKKLLFTLINDAERIKDIVSIIGHVSNQTSLLALNATIEAAHAGEAGRGFAVVANAISTLADESKKSTTSIGNMISNINEGVKQIEINVSADSHLITKNYKTSLGIKSEFEAISHQIQLMNEQIENIDVLSNNQLKFNEDVLVDVDSVFKRIEASALSSASIENSLFDQNTSIEEIHQSVKDLNHLSKELNVLTKQFKVS